MILKSFFASRSWIISTRPSPSFVHCGTSLITRSDDNEETFKIRFDNYMKETESVLDYYKDKNKLVTIDSTQDFDSIANNIERVI